MSESKMSTIKPKKIEPGSELHFALLGVPMGWNFLTGKDYADMQAFAKAVWDAATERAVALRDAPAAKVHTFDDGKVGVLWSPDGDPPQDETELYTREDAKC